MNEQPEFKFHLDYDDDKTKISIESAQVSFEKAIGITSFGVCKLLLEASGQSGIDIDRTIATFLHTLKESMVLAMRTEGLSDNDANQEDRVVQ